MIAAVLLAAVATAGAPRLDGITIGENVTAVIKAREIPVDRANPTVSNTDAGHVWTWTGKDGTIERLTTDDDGVIQLIDVLASPANHKQISVPVAGSLQFNESGHINAQMNGGDPDLFGGTSVPPATVVGYAIPPNYGVLFAFDAAHGDGGMLEVITGTRDALFTTGLVPPKSDHVTPLQPATLRSDIYKVAKMVGMPPCGGLVKDLPVFVRIALRADGRPSAATIFWGTGDPDQDNRALYCPMHETFQPATLNGKPVPSVYFQQQVI